MSENAEVFIIAKNDLLAGIDKLTKDFKVAALTQKEDRIMYDFISSSSEIELEYKPTVLSPKKFFFPQDEVIVEYRDDGKVSPKITAEPMILFGIKPCDINGIKILDEAFADSNGDPNYLSKREQATIVGIDCKKVCDSDAFCYRVKANYAKSGFDVMLYEICDRYAAQIATDKGREFIKYFTTTSGNQNDIEAFIKEKEAGFRGKNPLKDLDKLPEIMQQNSDHKVWDQESSRCLSCGSCIMVCPTCYCFDVVDELALNLKKGERIRRWDACMLSSFAEVAGGESFRKDKKDRLHHRISRKFNYLMKKHGQSVCIGCGRCVRACLANISPKTIIEEITDDKGE